MAERDSLTKLLTRGTFDDELAQSLLDAIRNSSPLSLIMADIDHFKAVNDTYGHQEGDAVLIGVAACIENVAHSKGRAYRYGGEEMALLLANHDVREATTVAERLRREVESMRINSHSVTASFGVGSFPDHGRTITEIVKAADTALYDAKNRGRNLVRVFQEPAPIDRAREPERKLPVPGALTEQQKIQLRRQHFRGLAIKCPSDGSILTVERTVTTDSPIASLYVWCQCCGLAEDI